MDEVKFFEDTANKTADEIKQFYSEVYVPMTTTFREMIRKYFSRHLMDTDEDHPLKCEITYEPWSAYGLSFLDKSIIVAIYQHPSNGDIWLQEKDYGDHSIDEYTIDELVSIIDGFKDYEKVTS